MKIVNLTRDIVACLPLLPLLMARVRFFLMRRKLRAMSGYDYAAHLKNVDALYAMGENCYIDPSANIADPKLVSIGNNVRITAGCNLFCHDGSVNMLNRAYGANLDAVGKIEIGDNVFVGHGATIARNIRIGDDVIIGMQSVVTKDVPSGSIMAGNPARKIGDTKSYFKKMQMETASYPWAEMIARRESSFDPEMEPILLRHRQQYFFERHAWAPTSQDA